MTENSIIYVAIVLGEQLPIRTQSKVEYKAATSVTRETILKREGLHNLDVLMGQILNWYKSNAQQLV